MKATSKKAIIAISLLILVLSSCTNRHIYQGDRYFESLAYSRAIPHYEKAYFKRPTKEVGVKLAESYFKTNDLQAAEAIYEKVVTVSKEKDEHYFNYARVLMANGKYDEAKFVLNDYLTVFPNDEVAMMLLASCNSVNERFRDTTLFVLHEIPTEGFVNAFSVAEYQDKIVFVADREPFAGRKKAAWTGNTYLDLYQLEKSEEGDWLHPQVLKGDINGAFHEGPATFNSDGTQIYFTRSNYYKRKMEINENRENNLKIFTATLIDGEWKNLQEMPFNSDDYSVGHPALTPCCSTMYFVSDMPGGFGGTDIYMTTYADGQWGTPENLGPDVNTAGNEMFPYYDEDDNLYFSSDAHNTMGGLDVFITYFNGERWVKPENMNYPINSIKDDFGFVMSDNKSTGFVSSRRTDSDKIYTFDKYAPKFNLIGFAHKKGSDVPVEGVIVEVTDQTGKVLLATSDKDGKFKIKLEGEHKYALYCTKMGCFSRTDEISTVGLKYSEDFYADFIVEEIIVNKPIVLENIYYDFDKWEIRPDAALELNKLVRILKDNPEIDIEMGSHTDSRGSDKYNLILSDRRAYSAVQYLIQSGISSDRLTYKGYGETQHINNCKNDVPCSEAEHQMNRRTEFKVTKINK
jgi:outer membrane protein OmpA-like peptidoglycan-associated protein